MGSVGLEPSTRCAIDAVTALRLVLDDVTLGARRPLVGPSVLRSHALSMLYQEVRRGALDEKTARERLEGLASLRIRLLGDRVSRATAFRIARELARRRHGGRRVRRRRDAPGRRPRGR
nr:hypothetical protein [Cellulosimicrobium sp. MM]